MPLEKSASREAFSHNVAAERRAGKPEAQAVAIAYSEQREARKDAQNPLGEGLAIRQRARRMAELRSLIKNESNEPRREKLQRELKELEAKVSRRDSTLDLQRAGLNDSARKDASEPTTLAEGLLRGVAREYPGKYEAFKRALGPNTRVTKSRLKDAADAAYIPYSNLERASVWRSEDGKRADSAPATRAEKLDALVTRADALATKAGSLAFRVDGVGRMDTLKK